MHRQNSALLFAFCGLPACGGSPFVGTFFGTTANDSLCEGRPPQRDVPMLDTIVITSQQGSLSFTNRLCREPVPATFKNGSLSVSGPRCGAGFSTDGPRAILIQRGISGTLTLGNGETLQVVLGGDAKITYLDDASSFTCHIAERGTLTREK